MHYPAPDIIASTKERKLVIECKSCKGQYQYFEKKEIGELKQFGEMTNAEPWISVRFNNKPWYFLKPHELKETDKNFAISKEEIEKIGKLFIELVR